MKLEEIEECSKGGGVQEGCKMRGIEITVEEAARKRLIERESVCVPVRGRLRGIRIGKREG